MAAPPEAACHTQATYWPLVPLAAGGMGTVDLVFRAEGRFRRLFARKRMRAELGADAQLHAMFLDEARLAGLVRHPNVVPVIDVGEDAAGPFLISEYVEGLTLAELVDAEADQPGGVPLAAALEIVRQAARGLHAIHELEADDGTFLAVIHRDVTPQNILVGFDGFARVADFSVARAWGRLALTAAGAQKGKAGYMSPEQLRFEDLDRRADLFALGVVLVEALAGTRLYGDALERAAARRILVEPPPDIGEHRRDVPASLVALLFSLLAKVPAERPATARDLGEAIGRILIEDVEPTLGTFDLEAFMAERFVRERGARRKAIREALVGSPGR